MALYHLDPRQAASGAAPDAAIDQIETYQTLVRLPEYKRRVWRWTAVRRTAPEEQYHFPYPTEQAALRAAREAAGFGHVAEQPCERRPPWITVDGYCMHCRWPRAAHREGGQS